MPYSSNVDTVERIAEAMYNKASGNSDWDIAPVLVRIVWTQHAVVVLTEVIAITTILAVFPDAVIVEYCG